MNFESFRQRRVYGDLTLDLNGDGKKESKLISYEMIGIDILCSERVKAGLNLWRAAKHRSDADLPTDCAMGWLTRLQR